MLYQWHEKLPARNMIGFFDKNTLPHGVGTICTSQGKLAIRLSLKFEHGIPTEFVCMVFSVSNGKEMRSNLLIADHKAARASVAEISHGYTELIAETKSIIDLNSSKTITVRTVPNRLQDFYKTPLAKTAAGHFTNTQRLLQYSAAKGTPSLLSEVHVVEAEQIEFTFDAEACEFRLNPTKIPGVLGRAVAEHYKRIILT